MNKVIVFRHGQKDSEGDLTAIGAAQIYEACVVLKRDYQLVPQRMIFHSGLLRTRQCALVAIAAFLDGGMKVLPFVMKEEGLNFSAAFKEAELTLDEFKANREAIKEAGGMVSDALNYRYPNIARRCITKGIQKIAAKLEEGEVTVGVSHSPYFSLAVPLEFAGQFPYDPAEASAVVYTVSNKNEIIGAGFIKVPEI